MRFLLLAVLIGLTFGLAAQSERPYHMNGDASQENCNCYTLTPDQLWSAGSVWNINKINLDEPFDYKFSVYLGCDNQGADGIAFVLQPISTSIGSQGGGMGYEGVSPSIGILVDTWQNIEDNDPWEDHIAIHKNGIIDHGTMSDVTTPVPASAISDNIEDCNWHVLRIIWDPAIKNLRVEFDGVYRTGVTYDLVKEVFNDDPMVFWGFTSATGGAKNHQRFCTSLDAKFIFPEDQTTCFPTSVQFIDSSLSFGTIEKWFWDFGDGTTWESSSVPPPHNYSAPGEYEASLRILGNDGCLSEPFVKTIVMGTEPQAGFRQEPSPACEGVPITFEDTSYVQFGTIDKWNWKIGPEIYTDQHPPPRVLAGATDISLSVSTKEGCVSETATASIPVHPVPAADFFAKDICITETSIFEGINARTSVPISRWQWSFGDGNSRQSLTRHINYQYRNGGDYQVQLTAISDAGCPSETISKNVQVYETRAFAGNDTIIAQDQPYQLQASGGQYYKWTPAIGLNSDSISNPVATLPTSVQYVLTAYTDAGCPTFDTLNLKVFKGPAFYVPSAFTPNGDGRNDDFRFIAVGMSKIDLFQVYNRYGQLVYSSNQTMKGWDGRVAGTNQPAGTYVWVISGTDYTGLKHTKKGTVTLVR